MLNGVCVAAVNRVRSLGLYLQYLNAERRPLLWVLHLLRHAGLLLVGVVVSCRIWLDTLHGHLAWRIRHLHLSD